jgi:isopenicillin N synthase-like dioxygenase
MSGATSFTSVPIVDISELRSPDRAERERVAGAIGRAASEIRFFYVSGAGVDDALFERMLASTKKFFGLPFEERCGPTSGCPNAIGATCPSARRASNPERPI